MKLTKSEKTFTVSDLQRGAIASGKKEAIEKFKEYCKANNIQYDENMLDLAPIERYPAPVVKMVKLFPQKLPFFVQLQNQMEKWLFLTQGMVDIVLEMVVLTQAHIVLSKRQR